MLAAAAIVGAVLVAVPLLLSTGASDDDAGRKGARELAGQGSGTLLNGDAADRPTEGYVTEKPSPSPRPKRTKKAEAPAKPAPVPAESSPEPRPSSSPEKTASSPKAAPERETVKESPKPEWTTETVSATSVLEVGQAWTTNRIRMVMQGDGNLVVYNENGKAIWASMTFGENHKAIFQTDGNLVIHNADDRPIWAAGSYGHEGAKLVLRADAEVVVMDGSTVVWST